MNARTEKGEMVNEEIQDTLSGVSDIDRASMVMVERMCVLVSRRLKYQCNSGRIRKSRAWRSSGDKRRIARLAPSAVRWTVDKSS